MDGLHNALSHRISTKLRRILLLTTEQTNIREIVDVGKYIKLPLTSQAKHIFITVANVSIYWLKNFSVTTTR